MSENSLSKDSECLQPPVLYSLEPWIVSKSVSSNRNPCYTPLHTHSQNMVIVLNTEGKTLLNKGQKLGSKEMYLRPTRLLRKSLKEEGMMRKSLLPTKIYFYYE